MTRANANKTLKETLYDENTPNNYLEAVKMARKDMERVERVEALLNDPVNRAKGSVSIAQLREVMK